MEQLLLFQQDTKRFLEAPQHDPLKWRLIHLNPVAALRGDTAGCKPVSNKEELVSRDRLFKSV